ncbi:hypothetical protein RRF57_013399 [Xylaria bambusicola]|uniref:Uncharacterized protein n=1 Tax=Xylaria bambusicola TaxID=326684 RepID=A0AAN7V6H6_9PEZI
MLIRVRTKQTTGRQYPSRSRPERQPQLTFYIPSYHRPSDPNSPLCARKAEELLELLEFCSRKRKDY